MSPGTRRTQTSSRLGSGAGIPRPVRSDWGIEIGPTGDTLNTDSLTYPNSRIDTDPVQGSCGYGHIGCEVGPYCETTVWSRVPSPVPCLRSRRPPMTRRTVTVVGRVTTPVEGDFVAGVPDGETRHKKGKNQGPPPSTGNEVALGPTPPTTDRSDTPVGPSRDTEQEPGTGWNVGGRGTGSTPLPGDQGSKQQGSTGTVESGTRNSAY